MKTLVFDIEVSPTKVWVWGKKMWEENIIKVIEHPFMLSVAFKWIGEETQVIALPDFKIYKEDKKNDRELIKKLRELLSEADVVVGQNSDKFDIKWFNTRCLIHGLSPPEAYKTLDTLKLSKKYFRFISNKLDAVGDLLGHGRKAEHEGFPLWEKCMEGDLKAWEKMKEYNKRDVDLTADIFKDYLPWIQQKKVVWAKPNCPKCNQPSLVRRGIEVRRDAKYQRYSCKECGTIIKGERIVQSLSQNI